MRQELTQAIEDTARAVVNEVHTMLPGEIVSFDADKCMATVKPIGKYVTSNNKSFDYPSISEVPLVFPYCQQTKVGMAFPVNTGDSCLIIISEVELDEWRSGAESEGSLRYDLTNAVAIPGLMKSGGDLIAKAVNKNAAIIGAPGAELSVGKNTVEITVGDSTFSISEVGIAIGGDLTVTGNISYTGSLISPENAQNEVQLEEV